MFSKIGSTRDSANISHFQTSTISRGPLFGTTVGLITTYLCQAAVGDGVLVLLSAVSKSVGSFPVPLKLPGRPLARKGPRALERGLSWGHVSRRHTHLRRIQ